MSWICPTRYPSPSTATWDIKNEHNCTWITSWSSPEIKLFHGKTFLFHILEEFCWLFRAWKGRSPSHHSCLHICPLLSYAHQTCESCPTQSPSLGILSAVPMWFIHLTPCSSRLCFRLPNAQWKKESQWRTIHPLCFKHGLQDEIIMHWRQNTQTTQTSSSLEVIFTQVSANPSLI